MPQAAGATGLCRSLPTLQSSSAGLGARAGLEGDWRGLMHTELLSITAVAATFADASARYSGVAAAHAA